MLKVMIIDDDFIVRQGMCDMIAWETFDCRIVAQADDGEDALRQIPLCQPDIVLTDVVMPRMTGLALLSHLRTQWPWIKVIMVSAHDEPEYIRQAMKNEAVDYLLKPFDEADVTQVLLRVCEKIHQERIVLSEAQADDTQRMLDLSAFPKKVHAAIMEADLDAAILSVHALFYALRANNMQSNFFVMTLCTELLLGAMQRLQDRIPKEKMGVVGASIGNLSKVGTIDAMEKIVVDALLQLIDVLSAGESASARLVQQTIREIQTRYAENLTIAQLADSLHVSENYLQTLFKQEQGQTIRRFMTHVRIDHAKTLLRDTNEKVSQIGVLVGYHDTDYFTRIFRKITTITPNQYREKHT
ncbi:MAG: response regulator [Clostridia bacterium]